MRSGRHLSVLEAQTNSRGVLVFVVFVFVGFCVCQSMPLHLRLFWRTIFFFYLTRPSCTLYTTTPTTQRFRRVLRCLSEWRRQLITAKSMASARAESSQKSEKVLAAHILDGWKAVVDRNNLHKWLFGRLMSRCSVQYVLLVCYM
jgi:hypothetical protein